MGSKSKSGKRRQVDFSSGLRMLSEAMDEKFLQNSKHFAGALASAKMRLEVLEDLLMEKFGETEASLKERVLLRVEKNQGFKEVDSPVLKGSPIRIKVKEEVVGKESPTTPYEDAFMAQGHNQISEHVDTLVLGQKAGETREVVVADPDDANVQRKITVLVVKVFEGGKEETTEEVAASN